MCSKLSRFWELLCVGPDTYVGGVLTFWRECDSLHAKITRSQRLSNGHKHKAQRAFNHLFRHKLVNQSFNTAMFF